MTHIWTLKLNFSIFSFFLSWDLHVTSSCHRIKLYSMNRTREATRKRLELLRSHGADIEDLCRPFEYALEDEEAYLNAYRAHKREPES